MTALVHQQLPPLYGDQRRWGLVQADAVEVLRQLPAHSVDAVVVDPPYGLAFKGEHWDGGRLADGEGFQAFTAWWAAEVCRVLRPGGYLAAFGAPRTVHRLVAGCEDAGLEIRDQLLWCFAGVPKSGRLPGGLSSTLAPAYEPIVLARKPLDRLTPTIMGNVARHGTGALNIGTARIARPGSDGAGIEGFWPANLLLGHEADCDLRRGDCLPECAVPLIDRIAASERAPESPPFSRLFYAAKARRAEREAGLEHLPKRHRDIFVGSSRRPRANHHPTVKPIALMRWVVRLVVPPGGVVLDLFAGSGSTGVAAVLEARPFLGIEREPAYVEIARARIAHWAAQERSGLAA